MSSRWSIVETVGARVVGTKALKVANGGDPAAVAASAHPRPMRDIGAAVLQAVVGPTGNTRCWRRWDPDAQKWSGWVRP